MSIKLMSELWDNKDPRLTGNRLLILLCLADHANDAGVCWPSMQRLADRARIDRRNVVTHIRDLEAIGYLEITRKPGGVNTYRVIAKPAGSDASITSDATVTCDASITGRCDAGITGGVMPASHEPSFNRQKNRKEQQQERHARNAHVTRTEHARDPEQIELPADPTQRAVTTAMLACGMMLSKSLIDEHMAIILDYGLSAWREGWRIALENGKHGFVAYVRKAAYNALQAELAANRKRQAGGKSNGHGGNNSAKRHEQSEWATEFERQTTERFIAKLTPEERAAAGL